MLSSIDRRLWAPLVAGLVLSALIGPNPASCVAALGVILASGIADRYFQNTYFDDHKKAIERLQSEVIKLKEKQDKSDLASAFKPRV